MGYVISERTYVDLVDRDGHRFDLVGVTVDRPGVGLARTGFGLPSLVLRWSTEGCAFTCSTLFLHRGDMRFAPRAHDAGQHVAHPLEASR